MVAKHDLKQMEIGLTDQDEGRLGKLCTSHAGATGSLCSLVLIYLLFQHLMP